MDGQVAFPHAPRAAAPAVAARAPLPPPPALPPAPAPLPAPAPPAAPAPPVPTHGWTPERQRRFLEALADGHSVVDACRLVGLSHQSAYAFRRTPRGGAFAIGWQAALLVARDVVADALLVRAVEGQIDTLIRDDGTRVERHRFDNRLACAMLARLDRLADAQAGDAGFADARQVAARFDAFLDTLPDQCRPRLGGAASTPQLPQPEEHVADDTDIVGPVWFDPALREWRTIFPPPPGFAGKEEGGLDQDWYSRTLTEQEAMVVSARRDGSVADRVARGNAARDRWFAAERARIAPGCAGAIVAYAAADAAVVAGAGASVESGALAGFGALAGSGAAAARHRTSPRRRKPSPAPP